MEVKNLVLDVLLPGIAVVATGLFTYALTSGPEEFEDLNTIRQNLESLQSGDNITDQTLNESHEKSNDPTNNAPEWAAKLVETINGIAIDVKQLQERQQPNEICKTCRKLVSNESKNNDDSLQYKNDSLSDPVMAEPISLDTWLSNLRTAVTQMGAAAKASSPPTPTETTAYQVDETLQPQPKVTAIAATPLQKGCDMLLMYLKNIKLQPGVPRYRKISTTNASFRESMASLVGHQAVLEAVGFAKAGSYFEWTWIAKGGGDIPASNLNAVQTKKQSSLPVPEEAMVDAILGEGIKLLEELRRES